MTKQKCEELNQIYTLATSKKKNIVLFRFDFKHGNGNGSILHFSHLSYEVSQFGALH